MIKITKKEEDFRIYVEDDKGNYISSDDILKSEKRLGKSISFFTFFKKGISESDKTITIDLPREHIKSLAEMLNEVVKYL